MISRETVDEVILRNDIESLIGSYVSLKRAGSNLKGLCPFHNEKTPSFTVYPAANSFYCFGCGVGGNAITFIRQIEHLDYPDAIEFLAKRAGITVISTEDAESYNTRRINKQRLFQMNADAARFFHHCLLLDNPKSKEALSYFIEKRQLSMATIKHFGLGFAPDSFDALLKYMTSKGYEKDELVLAFLAGKTDKGHYYDAFRNRVMFPIIDTSNNVIAFGGRVMDDSKPKYKNTMDTPVFKKSRNLFALNFARQSCSERIILCEGYMDVIALHSAGFTNAVATLGTAITAEQARLMSRYTKKVIISYDADEAGQKAAVRAMRLLEEVGLEVGVLKMPDAKDPDEYIKKHGKEKFAEVISGSKSKFEYTMDSILAKYDITLPQDLINALGELERVISGIYSRAERDVYIRFVADKLGAKIESVTQDVEALVRKNALRRKAEESKKLLQQSIGYSDKVNPDYAKLPTVASAEENVLGLMMLYSEHQKNVFQNELVSEEHFLTEFNRRVFLALKKQYFSDEYAEIDWNVEFTPEEVGRITKMKVSRMQLAENGSDVLLDSVSALKSALSKNEASSVSTLDGLEDLLGKLRKEKDGKQNEQR